LSRKNPANQTWVETILKLGWVSFFADVASEMTYPVIPSFLVQTLKAPVQALGFIEGAAEALVSFMKGWSGLHFDRTGKRLPFIQWGYGLSAAGKPIIALARIWPIMLLGRLTDRFGKGIRTTARDAVIADAAGKDRLGKAYGLHRGMDTAGALVGVLLLLLLLSQHWSSRAVFVAAAIPGFLSLAITFTVRDPRPQKDAVTVEPRRTSAAIRLRELPTGYWRALALTLVFALANSSDTFILLRAGRGADGVGLTLMQVVAGYMLYNVAYTALSYPAGALSDKIGRWKILGAGWAIYAASYLGFAHATVPTIWPLFALYGCYMGMTDGVSKALVASYAPEGGRGTALGFFYMTTGIAILIGNTGCGLLWHYCGPRIMFTACAAAAAAAVLLIPLSGLLLRRRPNVV
jgi:MFS family permease